MARNPEYTCDKCGAQFGSKEGYGMTLSKNGGPYTRLYGNLSTMRYDLCDSCAEDIMLTLTTPTNTSENGW